MQILSFSSLLKRLVWHLPAVAIFATATCLQAAPVVANTGNPAGAYLIGSGITLQVAWTQSTAAANVAISATLLNLSLSDSPEVVQAFLTTAVGPGTSAAQQIAHSFLTVNPSGSTPADHRLFEGLELGPGTYYLTLVGGTPSRSWQYGWDASTTNGPVMTASGVTFLGSYSSNFTNGMNADYAPASQFRPLEYSPALYDLLFSVTGDFAPTSPAPEPAALSLLLSGGVLLWCARRSRQQNSRSQSAPVSEGK